jgi:V/A-type H+-transporting ATPase subunit C
LTIDRDVTNLKLRTKLVNDVKLRDAIASEDNIIDMDYLYASTNTRCLERFLLNRAKFVRMSEAKSIPDALKVLAESGWNEIAAETMSQVEEALATERGQTMSNLYEMAPDKNLVNVFMLKYDYHNIKTYLKGEGSGNKDYENLFVDAGMVPLRKMLTILREKTYMFLSTIMKNAVIDADEMLARTGDAQLMDILLDKACYQEMLLLAEETEIELLIGYVEMAIDTANLRAAVRMKKTGRNLEYMRQAYISGGNLNSAFLVAEITPEYLDSLFAGGPLAEASQVAGAILRGNETMSMLDLAADNALTKYVRTGGIYATFGPEVLIGYLTARETEITAIRVVVAGIAAGLPTESITERLRDAYV